MTDEKETTMITHTFPLREGCYIQMRLPLDLNDNDVERLVTFLNVVRLPVVEHNKKASPTPTFAGSDLQGDYNTT